MRIAELALSTDGPDRLVAFYERVPETTPESRRPRDAVVDGQRLIELQ